MKPPPVQVYTPFASIYFEPFRMASATAWCEENFGPRWGILPADREGQWAAFAELHERRIRWHFATEKMATMFILRWA